MSCLWYIPKLSLLTVGAKKGVIPFPFIKFHGPCHYTKRQVTREKSQPIYLTLVLNDTGACRLRTQGVCVCYAFLCLGLMKHRESPRKMMGQKESALTVMDSDGNLKGLPSHTLLCAAFLLPDTAQDPPWTSKLLV